MIILAWRVFFRAAVSLAFVLASSAALAQDPAADDDAPHAGLLPGLVATRIDRAESQTVRIDARAAIAGDASGLASVVWRGKLFAVSPGEYRVSCFADGEATVTIAGQTVVEASSGRPAWLAGRPLALEYGYHDLEVRYKPLGDAARLALFWSGPQFGLEPVSPRELFHHERDHVDDLAERGRILARAMRCTACHQRQGASPALASPDLTRTQGNLNASWLRDWLLQSKPNGEKMAQRADRANSRQRHAPRFSLTPKEADDLTAALMVAPPPENREPPPPDAAGAATPGDAAIGRRLFRTVGCLACHQAEGLGVADRFDGGDLSQVATKRPSDFFRRWLATPQDINPAHRMPTFTLGDEEIRDLAAYLGTLGSPAPQPPTPKPAARAYLAAQRVVARYRCQACHQMPERLATPAARRSPPLSAMSDWSRSCANQAPGGRAQHAYDLGEEDRRALRAWFSTAPEPAAQAEHLLAEQNCLQCHARDQAPGLRTLTQAILAAEPELAPTAAFLIPPALTGVGDKLHDRALRAAILREGPALRPWLHVRMPKFALTADELAAAAAAIVEQDRVPDVSAELAAAMTSRDAGVAPAGTPPQHEADEAHLLPAGSRLVTSNGFGCTSCHALGKAAPVNVAPAARGTDLTMAGERIRRPWFDRWVRNPVRIVPLMEMPSIQKPVRGVLDEQLDRQLAAVWHVLNRPGFDPPQPGAVRTVRMHNAPGAAESGMALTDSIEIAGRPVLRPLLTALPNRHNVLFDLERGGLAGWWVGDAASQHARGKSWLWEPAGSPVIPWTEATPEVRVTVGDARLAPVASDQGFAQLDGWEHVAGGLKFWYRLRFEPATAGGPPIVVQASQTTIADGQAGFRRALELQGLPPGASASWRVWPGNFSRGASDGDRSLLDLPGQPFAESPASGAMRLLESDADGVRVSLAKTDHGVTLRGELHYACGLAIDRYIEPAAAATLFDSAALDVVPGFEAVRLPLPIEEMPTALAWREDGTLAAASLKGRVVVAEDADGDGLPDRWRAFSDELPAPYGLVATPTGFDVVAKTGLIRLSDSDNDGRADRHEIVADGWGYTADYHDWAVGLPRDEQGRYFVALPCQQDERSPAAAKWRGTVVSLAPRKPTANDPRLFAVEPFCGGLRFPMGIARSRAGELFVTDNQGNYNPFNELNHLKAGARYGFINRLEAQPDFRPAYQEPAICIPHPWTRSVNGICFLDTPEPWRAGGSEPRFGPWEGHLVGCEYDTRRLVRLSLERVNGAWQGAAYPLSIAPSSPSAETFEGPVVCAVSPDGDLYCGNLRDSGWGGGQNTGSIVRLRPTGTWPLGIAEVRVASAGFSILFTGEVDAAAASRPENYSVRSYRRETTPAYGGPDVDVEMPAIKAATVAPHGRSVKLELGRLRRGAVYEIRVGRIGPANGQLQPAEAHYTLRETIDR